MLRVLAVIAAFALLVYALSDFATSDERDRGGIPKWLWVIIIVVLVYFGVTLVCAVPFLRVRPGWLLGWAGLLAVVGPVVNATVRAALDVEGEGGSLGWGELVDPLLALRAVVLTGTYPVVTWLVYVLVGMALAKVLLAAREAGTDRRLLVRLLAWGVVLVAGSLTLSTLVYEVAGRAAALAAFTLPDTGWSRGVFVALAVAYCVAALVLWTRGARTPSEPGGDVVPDAGASPRTSPA